MKSPSIGFGLLAVEAVALLAILVCAKRFGRRVRTAMLLWLLIVAPLALAVFAAKGADAGMPFLVCALGALNVLLAMVNKRW